MPSPPVSSADVGLYIHFPYCEQKCPYCDFNVHAIPHDDHAYANAIIRELEVRGPGFLPRGQAFRTLYFGGGTPSEWAPNEVARVLAFVKERFGLDPRAEITLEANPGTVAESRIAELAQAGVNRFSIGAQSFIDRELEALGRTHHAAEIGRAVQAAKSAGARVSLDLIYAIPGQTEEEVSRSIEAALALGVDHLSAYTLTIEPDTPLGKRSGLGLFTPMEDDQQAALIEHVTRTLAAHGFVRYEISSYAPPGKEALHNSIYWAGGAYLGLGAGAHSYRFEPKLVRAVRRENVRAPKAYLESALAGAVIASFEETLSRRQVIGDRLMVGLRTKWGVDLLRLAREADLEPGVLGRALEAKLVKLEADGLIERESVEVRPTARGFLFSDLIARNMLEACRALT